MDPLIERLSIDPDSEGDLLDVIGCACIDKKESAYDTDFDVGDPTISLSASEKNVAEIWGAYSLAINGGVTEVVSCMDIDLVVDALKSANCEDIADTISRMAIEVERVDREIAHLPREERDSIYSDLKFGGGAWDHDDSYIYDDKGNLFPRLRVYILNHSEDFDVSAHA